MERNLPPKKEETEEEEETSDEDEEEEEEESSEGGKDEAGYVAIGDIDTGSIKVDKKKNNKEDLGEGKKKLQTKGKEQPKGQTSEMATITSNYNADTSTVNAQSKTSIATKTDANYNSEICMTTKSIMPKEDLKKKKKK
ncbi:unnamed protein product [Meloidogyne enterolobii]|uniref:Uncharacterized protein n=1 Tax=Meloidogyne enterolobii TaxID=390850 RepID=A0ACB0ZTY5_MELEN